MSIVRSTNVLRDDKYIEQVVTVELTLTGPRGKVYKQWKCVHATGGVQQIHEEKQIDYYHRLMCDIAREHTSNKK